jgi:hypothetical protein
MHDRLPTIPNRSPMMPRRRVRRALACVAGLACLLCGPATAMAFAEGAPVPAPGAVLARVSNLRTLSEWAYPTSEAVVRAEPSLDARALGPLRFLTTDKQAQVYVVLASYTLASGEAWLE